MNNRPFADRFWSKVLQSEVEPYCWEWQGQKHDGYGRLDRRVKGKRIVYYAHRVSWQIHFGMIPWGAHVLHRCDNPSCVNPKHLFLGNQVANNNDKMSKKRQAMGVKFPHSKLTEKQVKEIRSRYARERITLAELSKEYGVAFGQIGAIIRREAWKHV